MDHMVGPDGGICEIDDSFIAIVLVNDSGMATDVGFSCWFVMVNTR